MDDLAKEIVKEVMEVLNNRKGFDWWWEEIDSSSRSDIKRKLTQRINKAIKRSRDTLK